MPRHSACLDKEKLLLENCSADECVPAAAPNDAAEKQ